MTTIAGSTNAWEHEGAGTQLPPGGSLPLAANEIAGQGQYLTFDASGNVVLVQGAVPCVVAAGVAYPAKLSSTSPFAASAFISVWTGYGSGNPASTIANDGFTAADQCVPAWGADGNTLGKLSNYSGSNRPLLGLVFGVDPSLPIAPRAWVGPVAQAVARGVMMASAYPHAWFTITDASASTTTAERAIPTSKVHGVVTDVSFAGAAIAADNTDYVTITIAKRVLADAYASAITIATYDSRAANQGAIVAFAPATFANTGTAANLNRLETDIFTIAVAKGGSGKQLVGEILVNGKAI